MASDPFDYLESRDDADELITEFGQAVSLRRTSQTGPAWDPTNSTADYATVAAKVEFTLKQMQGGNVLDTDERWLVAAGPLTALGITSVSAPDAIVTADGVVHPVLIAKPLNPAGVVVFTTVIFDSD